MAIVPISQLRTRSQTIKNAIISGENTANRVGSLHEDHIDTMESIDNTRGNQISSINSQIITINTDINTLKNRVSALEALGIGAELTSIKNKITLLEADVATLKIKVGNYGVWISDLQIQCQILQNWIMQLFQITDNIINSVFDNNHFESSTAILKSDLSNYQLRHWFYIDVGDLDVPHIHPDFTNLNIDRYAELIFLFVNNTQPLTALLPSNAMKNGVFTVNGGETLVVTVKWYFLNNIYYFKGEKYTV